MIPLVVKAELARFALKKLSELNAHDVSTLVRTVRRASGGGAWLPRLGGFGLGLLAGAAAGVLLAPRAGEQTRAGLTELLKRQAQRYRAEPSADAEAHSGNGARD
jgi:hypothetical protein